MALSNAFGALADGARADPADIPLENLRGWVFALYCIGGAFVFQALGYAPCQMCLWQRWPHAAAILLGALALALAPGRRALAVLGGLAALTTAGIGVFHTGVERDWWEGPASCGGESLGGLSGAELLSTDALLPVMCDEVAWELLGLSMASWNAVFSLGLAGLWFLAVLRRA